ncbi:hypothetical protein HLA99_12620 [Microbacterium ulmi]|uniref:Mannosyltransferase (PIG-V) n=1 Tax=Microbacterium ulmi TaxID=179095 RepID=A0A7Y2Q0T3_9MICO|nr:hypothetical protein [Microbacterium ulmi]
MPQGLRATFGQTWRRQPVALRIGILYLLSRAATTLFLIAAAEISGPASRFGPEATIGTLAMGWDAQWYWYLAENGYPADLPLTDAGQIAENPWAFMPLYAYLAKVIGVPLQTWPTAAILISLVAGYLACLVLFRMLPPRLDETAALWAVLFFASAPLAAIFQIGYAEALFLLWLFLALDRVMRRRYAWVYLLIPLMGFTRPGVLAFGLFLGLHGIHRWITRRREPLPARDIVHIVALGVLAVVVGFAWQVVAGIVTGRPGAYLATELAWRRNWLSDPPTTFVPFEGLLSGTEFWFTRWGLGAVAGWIALGLIVAGIAALLLFEPHVRRLGVDVRLWSASYLVYLAAVAFPQSSIFRLLVPLSPLWGAAALARSVPWRIGVLAACLLGQWWWIYNMFALANTYWQVP